MTSGPPATRSRSKAFLARLGLVVGATLAALGAAELAVRALLAPPELVRIEDSTAAAERRREDESRNPLVVSLRARPRGRSGSLFVSTPGGKRLRAGVDATIVNHRLSRREIHIRTNSLGYRNRELGPKTGRRVLFLGDSITFGDWLPEPETFVRVIEARASARGSPFETVNAAVGGIGLANELAILRETGLGTAPDTVVLAFYLNDFRPSPGVRPLSPPPLLADSRLLLHLLRAWPLARRELADHENAALGPATQAAWRRDIAGRHPVEAARGADPRLDSAAFFAVASEMVWDWGGAWAEPAWERLEPLLRELARQSKLHDFELRIVAFPVALQVEAIALHDEPQRRLAAIAAELGVPLLDLLPVLRDRQRQGSPPLFVDHCHHTTAGNAVIAEAVLEFLIASERSDAAAERLQ